MVLALLPGFLDSCTRALSSYGDGILFRMPSPVHRRFPKRLVIPAHTAQMPWLAALGMAIVLLAVYAYIA